jgi:hypothetical protein
MVIRGANSDMLATTLDAMLSQRTRGKVKSEAARQGGLQVARKNGIAAVVLRGGLVATSLAALTEGGRAQNAALDALIGTNSVEAQPIFVAGRLNACTMVFDAFAKDFTYKQGGYVKINGSFGLWNAKGQLGITLKVVLHDLDSRTMSFTPSPPASAYFVSGSKTTKDSVLFTERSDTPGGIFVALKAEPNFSILAEGVQHDKVTIAFARERGGMDIQLAIDTSVVDTAQNGQRTHSPKASMGFFQCSQELLENMTATTPKRP